MRARTVKPSFVVTEFVATSNGRRGCAGLCCGGFGEPGVRGD